MIEFGHATHPGLRRRQNQDTYCADPGSGLYLIADGMGDPVAGARAAGLARDVTCARLREGGTLESAVRDASDAITAHTDASTGIHSPVGASMVALRIRGEDFEAVWVGDSRLYLYCEALHSLSRDAASVGRLLDEGIVEVREARGNPRRNGLTQALGVTPSDDLRIEHVAGRLAPGMRVLLCSDGLTEHVGDDVLGQWLARDDLAAQEIVDTLLLAALDAGHDGNMTAMVLRCHATQDR